jgi:hypothetical protein
VDLVGAPDADVVLNGRLEEPSGSTRVVKDEDGTAFDEANQLGGIGMVRQTPQGLDPERRQGPAGKNV